MTGMNPASSRSRIGSVFTVSTSPTRPMSTSSPFASRCGRRRARSSPASLPESPTAFPPWWSIRPTIALLILPTRTISTISTVSSSVTRMPPTNRGSLPSRFMRAPICGPPPWTMTGRMPTKRSRITSSAKGSLRSARSMAAPPYLMTVVIKYGGAAMERADLKEPFALDVILLRFVGIRPVIVHGGGPQIGALMKRLGKEPRFVGGMRVTDEETVEIVEMVLVGKINKAIVGLINHLGGKAVGLSGKDAGLLRARRRPHRLPTGEEVDIGLVGEIEAVNTEPIRLLEDAGFVPVIAPVGVGAGGETYNINADLVAGEVAAALGAEKLIHLTDVEGILDSEARLISTLNRKEAERLMSAGVIEGGMLPKVESSLRALEGGTSKAHIIDGRVPHAILLELFTREGIGTEIVL